jgi:hypothetical protein
MAATRTHATARPPNVSTSFNTRIRVRLPLLIQGAPIESQ